MNRIDVSSSDGLALSKDPTRPTRLDPSRPSGHTGRSLSGLSDRELLSRVKELAARERAITIEILLHLIEVERRRLHVGLGFASMFDYCTRHLGYPSSSAARRIQTARCLRDYPEVYRLLEKNEVNLSTVSLVSSILTPENHEDILRRIRDKSQKEVEAIVADYRPPVSLRDRARPVWVAVPATPSGSVSGRSASEGARDSAASVAGSAASARPSAEACAAGPTPASNALPTQRTSGCDSSRCGSEKTPSMSAAGYAGGPPQAVSMTQARRQAGSGSLSVHQPSRLERKYQVQFLASGAFMKKLERARALLSNRSGRLSYEAVLEAALDEFLKDHDPEERSKRRAERKVREEHKEGKDTKEQKKTAPESEPSRRIPAAVRDAVFARDKGRCTYVGKDGKRCDTTHHLQIDHVVPFARGGTTTIANLRLLCERHNKLEAERVYGANAMKRYRARE